MTDKEKLYAVKNDKGEWLYSDEYNDWVDHLSQATFYDTFEDADDDIECWELSNAYVVELAEAPKLKVVSEKEAGDLDRALKPLSEPHAVANPFSYLAARYDSEEQRRLIHALVNGYTVAKEKRYQLKVPYADGWIFQKYSPESKLKHHNRSDTFPVRDTGLSGCQLELTWFTEAEIEHYGLHGCERVGVTDDEQ
ncbi:DUF1642 domain-containing protein [Lacticaseibacillus sp. 866-1]|uniref:DUF1642 domain-containing protein n=1 Tax=Lacticaseibacillus sp. 866-1 TaxID=2799576 RepID=UPI0019417B2B|nr:DUF1642 domain-containing protein [Lacticaseibacillus sp. 866-1]